MTTTLTGQETATLTDGTLTIELPGLTAIRIDAKTRTIAIDGISGTAHELSPGWFIADLRDGTYGDFHRLRPSDECFDPQGCASEGQHNALYPHFHKDIEEVTACQACIDRAADLRVLSGT